MNTELAIDFVESIKDKYTEEITCGEEIHDTFFHFFNDFIVHCDLVTHNNLPFKISKVYRFEDKYGIAFDGEIVHRFINEVNSRL